MVGAPQFDIRLQRHGIISLHERIQEFMNADRLLILEALMKIIPLHHARDPIVRGQLDEIPRCHGAHPSAVEFNQGLFLIENLEDLPLIGLGIILHLRLGEDLSSFGHSGGVADQAGKIADQENDLVAEVLEMPQLMDQLRAGQDAGPSAPSDRSRP